MRMYCTGCGRERTAGPGAADPGPCPECGGTCRSSVHPAPVAVPSSLVTGPVKITGNFAGGTT